MVAGGGVLVARWGFGVGTVGFMAAVIVIVVPISFLLVFLLVIVIASVIVLIIVSIAIVFTVSTYTIEPDRQARLISQVGDGGVVIVIVVAIDELS